MGTDLNRLIGDLPPIPPEKKGFQCQVLADSISPADCRLTSMLVKYPLIVHAEWCRHRAFSRSVASNRAIPTARIVQMVLEDPFDPIHWGSAKPGMQAGEELSGSDLEAARSAWNMARTFAIEFAVSAQESGLHKQIANRILYPYQWVSEVITATDDGWANFFALRCHEAAEPHMRYIAEMCRDAYFSNPKQIIGQGEWHVTFVSDKEQFWILSQADDLIRQAAGSDHPITKIRDLHLIDERGYWLVKAVSAARTARTSYRTHDGRFSAVDEDLALYCRLIASVPRHVSPTEHQARPAVGVTLRRNKFANFRGWEQHRLEIPDNNIETYIWPPKT